MSPLVAQINNVMLQHNKGKIAVANDEDDDE